MHRSSLQQRDIKTMFTARKTIEGANSYLRTLDSVSTFFFLVADTRDDLAAAFQAAGIPLKKLEHPSLRGWLEKFSNHAGCYPKDDKSWQVRIALKFVAHFLPSFFAAGMQQPHSPKTRGGHP